MVAGQDFADGVFQVHIPHGRLIDDDGVVDGQHIAGKILALNDLPARDLSEFRGDEVGDKLILERRVFARPGEATIGSKDIGRRTAEPAISVTRPVACNEVRSAS
jgi:hypothetical protein